MAEGIVNPKLIEIALQNCDTTAFERFSQTVFGAVTGPIFKPLGGHHDGGADGFIDADLSEEIGRPTRFFQASKEIEVETKIRKTVARLLEVGRAVEYLYYATSYAIGYLDSVEYKLSEELGITIRIYDRNFFVQNANHNANSIAAYQQYLRPSLAFLDDFLSPSYPALSTIENARAVCAFLGQEMERRIGTTQTLEAICDSLILWALEGTDPSTEQLMTEEEIVSKVENVIPTARRFFRGQVSNRLASLSKKSDGSRQVNVYRSKSKYCLPFESRETLKEHTIEDEKLKIDVTTSILMRLSKKVDDRFDTPLIEAIANLIHRTLETLFERQGFDAARHFLEDDPTSGDQLDARPIVEIAEDVLKSANIKSNLQADILLLMKSVLGEIFYGSTPIERTYCARLARTYILLFTIRNTPEIVEYFNSMSKNFALYVGTDLIVRAISEQFIESENQMTVNALKIIAQAGSKLILSEVTLEEVHSHIYASHREYINVYAEIDGIVDRDLASQCDRILIRAYYYSKLEKKGKSSITWSSYLNNFLTASKMTGPTSEASMKSLKDTLCNKYGFVFESREDMEKSVDKDSLSMLTSKIQELRRQKPNEDILAQNDALHILRVDRLRRTEEKKVTNHFGYRTWWLTQDIMSGRAAAIVFPKKSMSRYVMRPEFLINYIAYNPSSEEVRRSLGTIFPSLLGVRLGSRLEKHTLAKVLDHIRTINEVDPARAQAIISEHSDALKSQHMRAFVLKYTSVV
ncbi:MAG: hypothetical protein WC670_01435 [Pseudolabrys sp.]